MREQSRTSIDPRLALFPNISICARRSASEQGLNNSSINARCRPIASVICARFMDFAVASPACQVAEAMAPDETVIAMSGKDGAPLYLRTSCQQWFYHPTEKRRFGSPDSLVEQPTKFPIDTHSVLSYCPMTGSCDVTQN